LPGRRSPAIGMMRFVMIKKILLYLPALLFLVPLILPNKSDLVIFPGEKKYPIYLYSDNADSTGTSSTAIKEDTAAISFNFTLHRLRGNPYAGFVIDVSNADSFVDVSSYDSICIDIVTKQASSFEVQLKTFIDNVTDKADFRTCHTSTYQVAVDIKSKRYSIPINKFRLPDWWYTETYKKFGPKATDLPRDPNWAKLFNINFQSASSTVENNPDRYTISKIAFIKANRKNLLSILCLSGMAAYCVSVFFLAFLRGRRKRATGKNGEEAIVKDPPPIVFPDVEENETRQLIEYIDAHYNEPELTLEQVAQGARILPPLRVTSKLQEKFTMNFRQYLNDLRIRESKRLLANTDKNISEIAFAVGYNNIPHFNRVFKEAVGSSPTEYRETNHKAPDTDVAK
jgi:AraC-like DNA-binding protein